MVAGEPFGARPAARVKPPSDQKLARAIIEHERRTAASAAQFGHTANYRQQPCISNGQAKWISCCADNSDRKDPNPRAALEAQLPRSVKTITTSSPNETVTLQLLSRMGASEAAALGLSRKKNAMLFGNANRLCVAADEEVSSTRSGSTTTKTPDMSKTKPVEGELKSAVVASSSLLSAAPSSDDEEVFIPSRRESGTVIHEDCKKGGQAVAASKKNPLPPQRRPGWQSVPRINFARSPVSRPNTERRNRSSLHPTFIFEALDTPVFLPPREFRTPRGDRPVLQPDVEATLLASLPLSPEVTKPPLHQRLQFADHGSIDAVDEGPPLSVGGRKVVPYSLVSEATSLANVGYRPRSSDSSFRYFARESPSIGLALSPAMGTFIDERFSSRTSSESIGHLMHSTEDDEEEPKTAAHEEKTAAHEEKTAAHEEETAAHEEKTVQPQATALTVPSFQTTHSSGISRVETTQESHSSALLPGARLRSLTSPRARAALARFEGHVVLDAIVKGPNGIRRLPGFVLGLRLIDLTHVDRISSSESPTFSSAQQPLSPREHFVLSLSRRERSKIYLLSGLHTVDASRSCIVNARNNCTGFVTGEWELLGLHEIQESGQACVCYFSGHTMPVILVFESPDDRIDFIELLGLLLHQVRHKDATEFLLFDAD